MEKKNLMQIKDLIYVIRGQKVMLDQDLAQLYGIAVKRLNEAVKRNLKRFPEDFMFQLTNEEWLNLRSQIATSSLSYGGRRYNPFAFTEQGVSMLSSVINSEWAIDVNIGIMRAFVQLRHFINSQINITEELAQFRRLLMLHIDNCDNKFTNYDENIEHIIEVLNNLIEKPHKTKRIGF